MSKVAVVYWSGTGNTEQMAESVADGARNAGADVTTFTAAEFDADKMDEFDAIAFGCPSMGAEQLEEDEFEPMFTACESKLSGIGKSELAIELVKRGHRLVADDAVELRKVSNRQIMGTAPENIRHFIELRGIGIVNVARVFGVGAVKLSESLDLVVQLEAWDPTKNYQRTGLENEYYDILGVSIPSTSIPVSPGRNLAVVLETAAINNRQKKMGYNAAKELLIRLGLDDKLD